ncbi:MAG: MFS transporter [Desulfomonilaceae bacterium]|nr:MFS transporter [Desulfomonilaceae bacterium]
MTPIPMHTRVMIVIAALLAVFLGALDALIVSTAMPTIVSDLGGLELYGWVFSGYMLARTIALPIVGKLCDMYSTKKLFAVTMGLFIISSLSAGVVTTMPQLILLRAIQGLAAGGTFAVAYIVVADISPPGQRARMMGSISLVWGLASVLGPVLGGAIVTYLPWPWIFYINVPVGGAALFAVMVYFKEFREKRADASIDYWGAATLSAAVPAFLLVVLLGGREYSWASPQILALTIAGLVLGGAFLFAESRAASPILSLDLMRTPGFLYSSSIVFFCSFAIFSLIAFIPLFVQGALLMKAADVSIAMIPLSLGWSAGGLASGHFMSRIGPKMTCILGSLCICTGISVALSFTPETSLISCCAVFGGVGIGMGFIFIGTLIAAQNSLPQADRGVATSSQQFALNLGGTIGVGVSGGILAAKTMKVLKERISVSPDPAVEIPSTSQLSRHVQDLLRPEFQSSFSPEVVHALKDAVAAGVVAVFWTALAVSLLSVVLSLAMPARES